jgi:hypothetical protein
MSLLLNVILSEGAASRMRSRHAVEGPEGRAGDKDVARYSASIAASTN